MRGVCGPDDLGPQVAYGLLGRGLPDPVLRTEAVDQLDELVRGSPADAPGILGGDLPKRGYEVLSRSAESVGFTWHPLRVVDAAGRPGMQTLAPAPPIHWAARPTVVGDAPRADTGSTPSPTRAFGQCSAPGNSRAGACALPFD